MENQRISLAGSWVCVLDGADLGYIQRWFEKTLSGREVTLPGSLAEQRIGDPVTLATSWTGTIFDRSFYEKAEYAPDRDPVNLSIPFFLQPETVWVGAAWYQREFVLPAEWAGRRIGLRLERPHWEVDAWIDGEHVGRGESLAVPHCFELGSDLRPGSHRLTLRVDNRLRIEVGENAHSVTDHTQGNWNGVIGQLELVSTASAWVSNLRVYPSVKRRSARVEGQISSLNEKDLERLEVQVSIRSLVTEENPIAVVSSIPVASDGSFSGELKLGDEARLWDEFSPALYRAEVRLTGGESTSVVFGMREIEVQGRDLLLNGRKLFLRGTLDCCVFPLTGYPPMDRETWILLFQTYQQHGLNHVRFHSWCPPEVAFAAADELGMYLQVECGAWANAVAVLAFNSPRGIGDGGEIDRWMYRETERILAEYGNHPSFLLLAHGNEPGGPHHPTYLSKWVQDFASRDPRRLYTAGSGWPELPENHVHVIPAPRIHQWGDGLKCRLNGRPPATTHDYSAEIEQRTQPVIGHEIGQWCAYPPLHDTGKYTGHLKPRNYGIFRRSLEGKGLDDQLNAFVQASGKLQTLIYKEEIEASLRTPGLAGFQLLGLQDFPGQGTAPVGVLDAFGHSKGYATAETFRQFCGSTVLLARMDRRVFVEGDAFSAEIGVAHFGPGVLANQGLRWELLNSTGEVVLGGFLPVGNIAVGQKRCLEKVRFIWRDLPVPARYTLKVALAGTSIGNDWDVWLYPKIEDEADSTHPCISTEWSGALARAASGENVLLLLNPQRVAGEVALGFSTIFWNTSCTQGQAPHTLGILCDPVHPALASFPSEVHSNWQWWYLLQHAAAMPLDGLPREFKPIVQVIDDWFTNRRLGLLIEAKIGAGQLLICSSDLRANDNPVARQLMKSLVDYVTSDRFSPKVVLGRDELATIVRPVSE